MSAKPVLRVRRSGALLVVALISFVGMAVFVGKSWALSPLLLIPGLFFVWAWRAGTDVFPDRLRVRALAGSTSVAWTRVTGLVTDQRGWVTAQLDNGNVLRLTGVTRDNLSAVIAAGGQPINP